MKLIREENDFRKVELSAQACLDMSKVLPETIFSDGLQYYWFSSFDDLFMPFFFEGIRMFLRFEKEQRFFAMTIDPDPRAYLYRNFGYYGAFEFDVSDPSEAYASALNDFPADSPADAMIHNANLIAFYSDGRSWCIYGSRADDIAVYAFSSPFQLREFSSCFGENPIGDVDAAAQYAYSASGNLENMAKLKKNYAFSRGMNL